ncbi:class I SAM-dependent methyltransferase [Niallia circulans]|uniref:Class I SAM-dependent methyltransferase n=1 Tax=Niallia circulans TaxID=1397 RepID=A0A553SRA4_NIACI|nr:class I SAM-dependent methyltransferase [Niallia circulans]TRZ39520.1 class I SAM-dependent methyltransferase [Niallia circulans]
MDNNTKFNGKAKVYAAYRPDYPKQLLNDLISECELSINSTVADIGAGTGILTKQLLDLELTVFAVEPNEDMRQAAIELLKDYKCNTLVNGAAENTTLPPNSVDLVTAAQSFHWFNKEEFHKECQRILKKGGKVAIIANERIDEASVNLEIADVFRRYCPKFNGFSNGLNGSQEVYDSFFNRNYQEIIYEYPLKYNKSTFIGRHLSSSFALKEGDKQFSMLVEALAAIFDKYGENGLLYMPNVTKCRYGAILAK